MALSGLAPLEGDRGQPVLPACMHACTVRRPKGTQQPQQASLVLLAPCMQHRAGDGGHAAAITRSTAITDATQQARGAHARWVQVGWTE